MGAYTTLDTSPGFSEIRSAFNQSGQVSLNTYHTTYRYPRGTASSISINSYYKSTPYWHISMGHPYNSTTATSGWGVGISSVTISVGGTTIKTFNSGILWNSSSDVYVMANASYTTFTVTATISYGYTFLGWGSSTGATAHAFTGNPATVTASSYVNLRPICYGTGGGI